MKDCASCVMRRVSRRVVRAVFAAALVAGCGSAWADIPASAYVQDGLVAQFDGIENAGAGTHADSASVWKNLKGDEDLSIVDSVSVCDNCMTISRGTTMGYLSGSSEAFLQALKDRTFTAQLSVKTDASYSKDGYAAYLHFGAESSKRWLLLDIGDQNTYTFGRLQYRATAWDTSFAIKTKNNYSDQVTATLVESGDGVRLLVGDTLLHTVAGKGVEPTTAAYLVGRYGGNKSLPGEYQALRLYNRALEPEEIAWNTKVDSLRFGAAAGDYGWNAEKECIEYRVSARGTDGVTVSLNGETYSESVATDWTELGTPVTVTVTAQAPQGCSIIWEGVPAGVAAVRSGNSITLTLSEAATLRATAHTCATLYWRGTTDALASKAANWADAEGNPAASAPLNGDAIVLDANSANKPMTWDLDEVEPASWTQTADYTGTVTFQTGVVIDGKTVHGSAAVDADGTAVRELVIDGTVSLEGGKWTVTAQPTDSAFSQLDQVKKGLGLYRLQVRATGDFTIGADAKVSAGLCGFYKMGPGAVTNGGNTGGGSHGGIGGGGVAPYGSATDPRTQGSGCGGGGGSRAGGVVRLTVGGLLTVNGSVDADSEARANAYTAAGGSVCIVAGEIAGTGRISADGEHKTGGGYSPAGGGRVAVKVTRKNATATAFEGEIHAYGGGQQADATKSVSVPDRSLRY